MRLDEIERQSLAIEDEMSSLWPLEKIGGEILLMFRRYDNLFVISSLNLTRLSQRHSSIVKSLARSEAEVLRYGEILE